MGDFIATIFLEYYQTCAQTLTNRLMMSKNILHIDILDTIIAYRLTMVFLKYVSYIHVCDRDINM